MIESMRFSAIAISCALMQACHQTNTPKDANKVQAVFFEQTNLRTLSSKIAPSVWVDTNLKVTRLIGGGSVRSQKPYHIRIDYTDNSSSLSVLEITKLGVTYDDGIIEPKTQKPQLPRRIDVRKYETVNSVSDGRVVKSSVNIFSDVLLDAISRDRSFRIEMEGYFTTKTGIKRPFSVGSHHAVKLREDISPFADR